MPLWLQVTVNTERTCSQQASKQKYSVQLTYSSENDFKMLQMISHDVETVKQRSVKHRPTVSIFYSKASRCLLFGSWPITFSQQD